MLTRCAICHNTIVAGGIRSGHDHFCGQRCREENLIRCLSARVPRSVLAARTREIHQGECPNCGGPGPVDIHLAHTVFSFVVLTSQKSVPHLCCRSCGVKNQLGGFLVSFLGGWWALTGLLATPVYLFLNLRALCSPPPPAFPSKELERTVAVRLASELLEREAPADQ